MVGMDNSICMDSIERCSPKKAAVTSQQPWRKFIKDLVLPKKSSREGDRAQRLSIRELRYTSEEEGKEERSDVGSNSSYSGGGSEEISNDVPFRINERLRCIGCNKRRPSFSDTESALDIVKMPVGTVNPALKSSFSLTSLRSSTPTDSPEHGAQLRLKTERAYHSLTKKSRKNGEQEKEQWRKSWGSGISQDGKEFWEGFKADYDYLMAQNILDREPPEFNPEEKRFPRAPPVWSHSEFMDNFAQIYSWLKGIQDSVYGKEENVTDWKLRAERLEDMERQRFRLDSFKEESRKLLEAWPDSEAEVVWRVKHISDKWETVEAMMGGSERRCEGEKDAKEKIKHEIRCLRKWLKELDSKLKPLEFQRGWTKSELEAKSKELMVLHRDIESQKNIFSSLLKLCEKENSQRWHAVAAALQRKYHLHYLRSLEWQYHVESLISQQNKSLLTASNESDGEPVPKIRRFACRQNLESRYESEDSDGFEPLKSDEEFYKNEGYDCNAPMNVSGNREKEKMVGVGARSSNGAGEPASVLGTNSKTANILFSCANPPTESTPQTPDAVNAFLEPGISRSKEKPPNTGSFTWIYMDTDSEQEKAASEREGRPKKSSKDYTDGKDVETTSSEGGWTYKSSERTEKSEAGVENKMKTAEDKEMKHFSAKHIPSKDPIFSRKLVVLADELVRLKPAKSWKTRRGRTKKGSKEKMLDSCDASGEYTEDSDECQKSEDGDARLPFGRRYGSADGILEGKVQRRQRHSNRVRPLSMSSVSWSKLPRNQSLKSQSSMSESALNQMMELERLFSTGGGRGSKGVVWEEGSGSSSKRRRTKMKKQLSKKSESGSDGLTLSGSDSANASSAGKRIPALVKSGSFSGVTRKQRETSCFDSVSGTETETEEETSRLMSPVFRLGPNAGAVTVAAEDDKAQAEEQLSLNWDNYQEKYQSEAFSEEPPDSDTAKKLLEFGEDYGKFLGNQSDCASSRSLCSTSGKWSRCKIESDSDVDEIRQTLRESLEQLNLWELKFNKSFGGNFTPSPPSPPPLLAGDLGLDEFVSRTFLDEIIGVCKRNVECLSKLLAEVRKDEMLLTKEENYILTSDAMTSLLGSRHVDNMVSVQVQTDYVKDSWENFKSTAETHKVKHLRREMAVLKEELMESGARIDAMEMTVTSREELEALINQIQNELNLMKKGKNRLLQANVAVHRFLATAKHSDAALRDEVTELYQLWDQSFYKVSSQLFDLRSLSQTWHDFEDHLTQLQCVLRTDTLKVFDFALKRGGDSSLSLQDIAGILSDRDVTNQDSNGLSEKPLAPALAALTTEGSLSDSGISDSGSEQELSEREKRLAQLKRLAKRLETILAPGSQALSNMFERIEQAECQLRELQKTCRDLIVRSASAEEIREIVANPATLGSLDLDGGGGGGGSGGSGRLEPNPSGWTKSPQLSPGSAESSQGENAEAAEGKPGKKFWLWRLLRYALPFQLALVALFCIASILEPRCCDSLNNLELSLYPQVRYNSGPPPV